MCVAQLKPPYCGQKVKVILRSTMKWEVTESGQRPTSPVPPLPDARWTDQICFTVLACPPSPAKRATADKRTVKLDPLGLIGTTLAVLLKPTGNRLEEEA
jgi:hypothetical protein